MSGRRDLEGRTRRVDFLPELPRLDTGKLQRGVLRARYWEGRSRQI
jgi:long-chain acyl-CoA synthetase